MRKCNGCANEFEDSVLNGDSVCRSCVDLFRQEAEREARMAKKKSYCAGCEKILKHATDTWYVCVSCAATASKKAGKGNSLEARMADAVNHPAHYTSHPSGVECITVTEHMSFNVGNAIKYLWRADDKGDPIENLRKARWYVEREIDRRTALVAKRDA